MTTQEIITRSLAPLVDDLNRADAAWAVFGSAALVLNGVDVAVSDIDIMLTAEGAAQLETLWAAHRIPLDEKSGGLFRSRLSQYRTPGLIVELSGGLELFRADRWQPVLIHEAAITPEGIRHATLPECKRLLQLFGRPKDTARLQLLPQTLNKD